MLVYCDSSTKKACYIIEEEPAVVLPYDHLERLGRGGNVTVNEGEYLAVIAALTEAVKRKRVGQIRLLTDSQLVVNQVNGVWQCNKEHLRVLRDKVRLLAQNQDVVFEWVPREENLAGQVLEGR